MGADINVVDEKSHSLQGQYRSNPNTGDFIVVVNPLTPYTLTIQSSGYSTLKDDMNWDDSPKQLREETINPYLLIKE